jgi:hypothetical protein
MNANTALSTRVPHHPRQGRKSAVPLLAIRGSGRSALMIANNAGGRAVVSVGWSFDNGHEKVTVAALLGNHGTPDVATQGEAWLTTRIGPGTTRDHVVAHGVFPIPYTDPADPQPAWIGLFADLNLLPGDYYLTIASDHPSSGWYQDPQGASIVQAPGVTRRGDYASFTPLAFDKDFPPAGQFFQFRRLRPLYEVTGEAGLRAARPVGYSAELPDIA